MTATVVAAFMIVFALPGGASEAPLAGLSAADDDSLVAELAHATGVSIGEELPALEEELRPMLATLPSSGGRLGATAVRYALHRLLRMRRGWLVEGLDPEGRAWNESWPTGRGLFARIPLAARELLSAHLSSHGLGARGAAGLASVLEALARAEAAERMRAVLGQLSLPTADDQNMTLYWASFAASVYSAAFVLGKNPARGNHSQLLDDYFSMWGQFPIWPRVLAQLHSQVAQRAQAGQVNVSAAVSVAGVLGERLVDWQESECHDMKKGLMTLEDRGTGHIRLAAFYGQSLKGTWQFSESLPYLKQLGAVDESKGSPRVIIPNYMYGPSNCIATGESLSVCCRSECEAVQGRLERAVGAPEATPAQLADLVVTIPTGTVGANRSLSSVMRHRLNSIAASNGGRVPLHGRLFAQWLHHAYPRECPYPHLSGRTKPQHTEEWLKSTGQDYVATEADMVSHAGANSSSAQPSLGHGPLETSPWSYQEELFVPRPLAAEGAPMGWAALHGIVFAAVAAVAFGLLVVRSAGAARRTAAMARAAQQAPGQDKLYAV